MQDKIIMFCHILLLLSTTKFITPYWMASVMWLALQQQMCICNTWTSRKYRKSQRMH